MKIAICFSGHIRNFFDRGLNNFNTNLLYLREQGHEVDLFFSVWDTYEPSTTAWRQTEIESSIIDENLLKQMNPTSYLIEKYDDIKHNFVLKNIHPTVKVEPFPIISEEGILYSTPMFYKISSANNLKKEHELKYNFKYDVVVRYRAQIYMDEPLTLDGSSEIMDQYSEVYNNLTMLFEKYKNTGPERILNSWLIRHLNLNVQKGIGVQIIR